MGSRCWRRPEKCPSPAPRRKMRKRMLNEAETIKAIPSVMNSVEPLEIDKVIVRCKDLEIVSPEVQQMKDRFEALKVQVPLVKAMQNAMAEKDIDEMQEVLEMVKKQGLHQHPENWLKELDGEKLSGEMYGLMETLKAEKKAEDVKKKQQEESQAKLQQDVNTATRGNAFEVDEE